jgi:alkaline phosphatase D
MLGPVTENSVAVWARLSGEFTFRVGCALDAALTEIVWSEAVAAQRENDFIVVAKLEGLEPGTRYFYRLEVNGGAPAYLGDKALGSFLTAPAPGTPAKFVVAFGSCARLQRDPVQPIWNTVSNFAPHLFIWLGDNMYGDSLESSILAEEYRRARDVPNLQPVIRKVPQLAVWDDHDYGLNDHDRTNPIKEEALAVFKQYWPNPSYGLPDTPGVFFKYAYGGVDFFMVDCRYYRDPNADPDTAEKTFLGAQQLKWLKEELAASDAPFKVIVSGSGWTAAKGEGGDSWAAFLHERDALFEYIRTNEITGVILLSGDTHVGELNAIPWSDNEGYDFYDLVSSPLAQPASDNWRNRNPEVRLRPGFERPNVGVLSFDLTSTPTLTFNLYDEDGKPAWKPFIITADELQNGVQSYPDKLAME